MSSTVQCPVCGTGVAWSEASRYRPFCSERCKTIDLGDWAAERHVIAGEPQASTESASSERADRDPHE